MHLYGSKENFTEFTRKEEVHDKLCVLQCHWRNVHTADKEISLGTGARQKFQQQATAVTGLQVEEVFPHAMISCDLSVRLAAWTFLHKYYSWRVSQCHGCSNALCSQADYTVISHKVSMYKTTWYPCSQHRFSYERQTHGCINLLQIQRNCCILCRKGQVPQVEISFGLTDTDITNSAYKNRFWHRTAVVGRLWWMLVGEDWRNIINEYIDNNRDSLNSSRSTTLASFHQSSSESLFYPPMSSSLVGSSVNKFLVEGGRQSIPRLCEHPPQRIVPRKGVHTNYFRKAFLFCRVAWLCTGTDAGNCMVCQETDPGKRGWKAERSRLPFIQWL